MTTYNNSINTSNPSGVTAASYTNTNLTVNAAGLITAASNGSAGSGLTWTGTSSTSISAAVNNGYVTTASTLATATLPATAAVGSIVALQGAGTGLWKLAANTGQTIQFGSTATASAGSISAYAEYDTIQVVCIVANTTWSVSYCLSAQATVA